MKPLGQSYPFQHISLQVKSFQLCGIWFYVENNMKSPIFWFHFLYKVFVGIFVFFIPPLGQIIFVMKLMLSGRAEVQEVCGTINLILTEVMVSLELLILRSQSSLFKELMTQMGRKEFSSFQGSEAENILKRSVKLSEKLFVWLTAASVVDIIVHMIIVPTLHGFKFLPVNMDFIFFDVYEKSYFSIVVVYQILYKPILVLTFTSLHSLRWAFMLCAISQLDILIENFKYMKAQNLNDPSKELVSLKKAFRRNIQHHNAIIRFVKGIESTFGGQITLFFMINSCIICTTAMQFISIQNPLDHIMELFWMFAFLFILIFTLFIDCCLGSIITEKNSYISTVVYCYPWIDLPNNVKRNLIIFIGRNQRTLVINAAKLIPVSVETFTKIMNWTYKGFAILNHMKK